MAEPSIVLAKLDDDKLKESINSLVTHLESSLNRMKQSTTNAVHDMQKTLQSLGNVKIDSGGSADGGSSKRTKKQKEETQAVNDTTAAYDKLADAQQKASKKKGIEYKAIPSEIDSSLTYLVNVNKDVDAQMDAILKKEQSLIAEKQKEVQLSREIAEQQARAGAPVSGYAFGNTASNKGIGVDLQKLKEATMGTEEFTQAIARLTKKQEYEINLANADTDSYSKLSKTLKDLQTAYGNMTAAERKGENGTAIRASILEVEQAINRIKRESTRPVNMKTVLGLDEHTLDDIVYKMRMMQSYRGGLDITKPNQKAELEQINYELTRLQKKQHEILGQDKAMIDVNNALARSWNYMKNRLAFYFTVGASTQFVKNLIEIRSQYEMNERALGILIDSAERGSKIFNELSSMALVSPYTLIELSSAAKQLTAYDVAAKDVVDTTRRLADMTAAVGIPIERLTYALGQIKAYGYLNSRDARMFSNAGIPLVKELSKYYTELEGRLVSVGDVYDRMKKKTIEYNDVMSVMYKMTDEGGKFFDFQAKMADTLKVQLANLVLAWNNMLNDIGESNQGMIAGGIGALKELFLHWQQLNKVINDMVWIVGSLATTYIMMNVVFGKSTSLAIARAVAMQKVSHADAQAILSAKNLSASQLKLLVSLNRTNKEFVASVANLKKLTMGQIQAATSAGKLKTAWYALAANARLAATAVMTLAESLMAIAPQIAVFAVTMAFVDLIQTAADGREKVKDLNRTIVENAKESAKAIKETIDTLNESGVNKDTVSSLSVEEQKKAWDEIRERIELSSASSEKFISMLLKEADLSKRVALGLSALESIEKAHDLMALWHDDTIEVSEDFKILGIGADGLTEDLSDFVKYMNQSIDSAGELVEKSNTLEGTWRQILSWVYDFSDLQAYLGLGTLDPSGWLKNIGDWMGFDFLDSEKAKFTDAYKEVQSEIDKTYKSLYNQIEKDGVKSSDVVYEMISKTISNIATERKWSEQETLTARLLLEQKFAESDMELFKKSVEGKNAAWEAWMNYLTKMHKTEFAGMANEEITKESWAQDKRRKLYEETFEKFKEYNALAYEQLKNSVNEASQLQVHIRVFYDKQNEPTDVEKDFKARTGYLEQSGYYNDLAKGAKSQVDIVDKAKKAQKEKAREVEIAEKAGLKYSEENLERLKKENEELIKIIHSYGALTDAEEKALNKKKKDILGEAFKKEVEIIQNIQKRYKEYRKEGVNAQEAISKATDEYGKTLIRVNSTLGKYGVKTKKSDELADMDMRSLRSYYTSLLGMASSLGNAAGVEALEKAIANLNVEITKVDYKTILDGLNSELGKLKDEYELGIELDANPELGDMFSKMFNIDRDTLPKDIYDYVNRIQNAVNEAILSSDKNLSTFNLLDIDIDKWAKASGVDVGSELYKKVEAAQKQARSAMKSYITDVNKQSKDLQYKLADTNGKIAIEEERLARLQQQLANETHDEKKRLLELEIQEQQQTINKLKEELLQLLPTYKALFGGIVEHSAYMTRRLARDMKKMLDTAKKDANGNYTITDPRNGKQSTIGGTTYANLVKRTNDELRKSATPLQKLKEAFTAGEDEVVDYWEGVEIICDEMQKLATMTRELGNFAEAVGFDENTVEIINDVAESIGGVATMGEGFAKIASGDWFGGAASVLSGLTGIISAWSDNYDNKINQEIERSELAVKKLELAYIDLQKAVDKAYGTSVIGAKTAAAAAKKLELQELERQLRLERSRDSKHRDESRIVELQKQIKELRYEIQDTYTEIVNDLMGTDVGSFAENLVSAMVDAFKQGEDAMKVFNDKFDELIDNMIMKSLTSRIVSSYIDKLWEEQEQKIKSRSTKEADELAKAQAEYDKVKNMSEMEWLRYHYGTDKTMSLLARAMEESGLNGEELAEYLKNLYEHRLDAVETMVQNAQQTFGDATSWTNQDINEVVNKIGNLREGLYDDLYNAISQWYTFGEDSDKNLSNLQQGVQNISEDTASAITAYLNGVSQQVYLHSDLLTQIRDTVVSLDFDVQLSVMSQMLLHLQNSYQTQQSIQRILENVLTPSGRAFAVEMN